MYLYDKEVHAGCCHLTSRISEDSLRSSEALPVACRGLLLSRVRTGVLLLQLDADRVEKQEEFAGLCFHFNTMDFKEAAVG